jgi:branched-chain amino acid transport system ATP-binding protein
MGLADQAERQARDLPIGQRKKLEMARVLATKPEMVLLDEVMGGLSPAERSDMSKLIADMHANGIGVVMIEHVMSTVMALSRRIIVLHHGRVIASGSPGEIRENREVIDAYLGRKSASRSGTKKARDEQWDFASGI